jgi:hypothetical protein
MKTVSKLTTLDTFRNVLEGKPCSNIEILLFPFPHKHKHRCNSEANPESNKKKRTTFT